MEDYRREIKGDGRIGQVDGREDGKGGQIDGREDEKVGQGDGRGWKRRLG